MTYERGNEAVEQEVQKAQNFIWRSKVLDVRGLRSKLVTGGIGKRAAAHTECNNSSTSTELQISLSI